MTKFLFFNTPFHGHVNPALPIAQELVVRGADLDYYLTDKFKQSIEAIGAVFHSISISLTNDTRAGSTLPLQIAEESCRIVPLLLEDIRARQPDCVVYDITCLWGRLFAQILALPAVAIHFSYAVNVHTLRFASRQLAGNSPGKTAGPAPGGQQKALSSPESLQKMHSVLEQLRLHYHLPPLDNFFMHAAALNIVCIPRVFQPASESFDERFVFVGPSIQRQFTDTDFPFDLLDRQPLLYISLGTVFNDRLAFYRQCFEAFGDQPWQVVLSIGEKVEQESLGPIPANFLVRSYVPQLEILQRASIFLTHGGTNSVMEALYYSVPLVVLPGTFEHKVTGLRVVELGLGCLIEEGALTSQALRDAVAMVASDTTIRKNVEHMAHMLQNVGGSKQAADAIFQFVKKYQ